MSKFFTRLCELLCPVKSVRKRMRARRKLIKLQSCNRIEIAPEDLMRVQLSVNGCNNVVRIGRLKSGRGRVIVMVHGSDNEIIIGDGCAVSNELLIVAGITPANFGPVKDVHIHIGQRTSFENTRIQTFNSHARIAVGERCMFSYGINLYQTDGHPVLSVETREVLNRVGNMCIGNHVWVGANATITKNVTIGDESIVGWGAVVSRSFPESHCVLAGNPARIVKQGVTWDANGAKYGYIDNEF